jgi:hypothetical protein
MRSSALLMIAVLMLSAVASSLMMKSASVAESKFKIRCLRLDDSVATFDAFKLSCGPTLGTLLTYDVIIQAVSDIDGAESVDIVKDGIPTGYTTPHQFAGLSGKHNFTVPSYDNSGNLFFNWMETGETTTTIIVTSGGICTACYYTRTIIQAYCYYEGTYVSVDITMDGNPTGYKTPYTFVGFPGIHTFTVPTADPNCHVFSGWTNGETSLTMTITVSWGQHYFTALYLEHGWALLWPPPAWPYRHRPTPI